MKEMNHFLVQKAISGSQKQQYHTTMVSGTLLYFSETVESLFKLERVSKLFIYTNGLCQHKAKVQFLLSQ